MSINTNNDADLTRPGNTRTGDLLDVGRLRRLRLGRKLSQRELARAAGLATSALSRIEEGDADGLLTLRQLDQMALTLGVTVTDLLLDRPKPTSTADPDTSADLSGDVAELAGLLLVHGGSVSRDLAARALGWDLRRFTAAAEQLTHHAPTLGLEVVWHGFSIGVTRLQRSQRVAALATLRRADEVARATKARTARLVYNVHNGDPDAATAPHDAISEAVAAGMLARDNGQLTLTALPREPLLALDELRESVAS